MRSGLRRALISVSALVIVGGLAVAPAHATAPMPRWGFAVVADPRPTSWTQLPAKWQWGTWKTAQPSLWADGMKLGTGMFRVRFPAVGDQAAPGIAHVTAISTNGHYCSLVAWSAVPATRGRYDQLVEVQCYAPGGKPADTAFSVLWTNNWGLGWPQIPGSYAYLHYDTATDVALQEYNSSGAAITVLDLGNGLHEVSFRAAGAPGPLGGMDGMVSLTPVSPKGEPRHCQIGSVSYGLPSWSVSYQLRCYDRAWNPVDSQFVISYNRTRSVTGVDTPATFAYSSNYAVASGLTSWEWDYNSGSPATHVNAWTNPATDWHQASFPFAPGTVTRPHVQLASSPWYHLWPTYCALAQPPTVSRAGAVVAEIACFEPDGSPAQTVTNIFANVTTGD